MAAGQHKRAVEAAKDLLRCSPGPESEAILADAFVARILAFEPHLAVEAESLYRLASERCPSARARLEAARPLIAARFGHLDEILRLLADEAMASEARAAVEAALRSELVDVRSLAGCTALPDSHPLRVAAAAVAFAFEAATSRPVGDEELELPQVSRRSPLAPWKPLVRAVACFHRGEDDACRAHLAAVDAGAAAGRLVPVLQELLAGRTDGRHAALVEAVRGGDGELRRTLVNLDAAFTRHELPKVLSATRDAVAACRKSRPDLVERLRQRVSARALLEKLAAERVRAALGGASVRNAAFHRLIAHVWEKQGHPLAASIEWGRFLTASVREGVFAADGPQAAAVLERMLDHLVSVPVEHLDEERREAMLHAQHSGHPADEPDALDPRALFGRLAAIAPRSEVFERWFLWARRKDKEAEAVAEHWHRAVPADVRPLLLLMELAEKRGAFKKALGLLAHAEAAERLDPEVARARFRLTCALALKHLAASQWHLVVGDAAALETLPESRTGRGPALVDALHLFGFAGAEDLRPSEMLKQLARGTPLSEEPPVMLEHIWRKLTGVMGGEREAFFLMATIARAARHGGEALLPPGEPSELIAALASAARLCDDVGVPMDVPASWETPLVRGLRGPCTLDDGALLALARLADHSMLRQLGHAVAAQGLARRTNPGRFLLVRAQSLDSAPWRRADCLWAAMAIAQKNRDTALLADIRNEREGMRASGRDAPSSEEVDRIVERELSSKEFPPRDITPPADAFRCDCPRCRAERSKLGPSGAGDTDEDDDFFAFEDGDDLEDDEDEDEDGELPFGPGTSLPPEFARLPPALLALFTELIAKHGDVDPDAIAGRDPDLYRRLNRVIEEYVMKGGALPGMGRHRRRPKRKNKRRR